LCQSLGTERTCREVEKCIWKDLVGKWEHPCVSENGTSPTCLSVMDQVTCEFHHKDSKCIWLDTEHVKDCRAPTGSTLVEDKKCAAMADEMLCHQGNCLWKGSSEWETRCQPLTHDEDTKKLCGNLVYEQECFDEAKCQWMGEAKPCAGKNGPSAKCGVFTEEPLCKIIYPGECKWHGEEDDVWEHPCWSKTNSWTCASIKESLGPEVAREMCENAGCQWKREQADGSSTEEPSTTEKVTTTETTEEKVPEVEGCHPLQTYANGTPKQQKEAGKCKNKTHQASKKACETPYKGHQVACYWGKEKKPHRGIVYSPHVAQH